MVHSRDSSKVRLDNSKLLRNWLASRERSLHFSMGEDKLLRPWLMNESLCFWEYFKYSNTRSQIGALLEFIVYSCFLLLHALRSLFSSRDFMSLISAFSGALLILKDLVFKIDFRLHWKSRPMCRFWPAFLLSHFLPLEFLVSKPLCMLGILGGTLIDFECDHLANAYAIFKFCSSVRTLSIMFSSEVPYSFSLNPEI